MRQLLVVTLTLLAAMLSGCSTSIFREVEIDDSTNTSLVLDAKQRAIISMKRKDNRGDSRFFDEDNQGGSSKQDENIKRDHQAKENSKEKQDGNSNQGGKTKSERTVVCSEPSPDIFAAIGQSFTGSGMFSPISKEAEVVVSHGLTESAASIQRAKTVQLLRDGLYATCLGYANGLLRKNYNDLLNRYLGATIILFAIEQITPQAISTPTALTVGNVSIKPEQPTSNTKDGSSKGTDNNATKDPKDTPSKGNTPEKPKPSEENTTPAKPSSRLGASAQETPFFAVLTAAPPYPSSFKAIGTT